MYVLNTSAAVIAGNEGAVTGKVQMKVVRRDKTEKSKLKLKFSLSVKDIPKI